MRFPQSFQTYLRSLREARDLSQHELEGLAHLPKGTISSLECGRWKPSKQVVADLTRAFRLETTIADGTDLFLPPVVLPSWLEKHIGPGPAWRRPDYTIERRWASTQKSYHRRFQDLVRVLERNPNRDQLAKVFCDFWVDSNLEVVYWMDVAGTQSIPHWLPPLFCNVRKRSIVCPHTELCIGDRPHPCLITQQPFRGIWFPQVTFLIDGFQYRPDCLINLGNGRCLVVQIDGLGHQGQFDKPREIALGIPTVRLTTGEVLEGKFWPKLMEAQQAILLAA